VIQHVNTPYGSVRVFNALIDGESTWPFPWYGAGGRFDFLRIASSSVSKRKHPMIAHPIRAVLSALNIDHGVRRTNKLFF
jgi:hypothetical protein